MRGFMVVALAVAVIAVAHARPEEDKIYTTKYDNVDLDAIIKNDRLMKNYVDCLLEKGNCSPDGKELKRVLPDALEKDCSKCSEKQRKGSEKIIRHLVNNRKDWWKELGARYDPQGTYKKKFENTAKEHGINLQ